MTLAIIFFLLYLAAVVTIGLIAARKESEEDFMIAGRKVKGIQLAATMSAGFFDGAILAIYLSYIYQFGLAALWLFIGLGLGFFLLRRFAQSIKQLADTQRVYTMPEYFFRTFGKRCGLMFSIMLIVQFFLLLTVNLIISAKVLTVIFPLPYAGAVLMGGIIVLTYLLLAGFKAVIRTDFFQLLIMILMSVMAAVVLLGQSHIPTAELNIFNFTRFGIGDLLGFLILGTLRSEKH